MDITKLNEDILKEANCILYDKGLLKILEQFGETFVTGSYFLNLMTWRDLDIYIKNDFMDKEKFCELGGKIALTLNPHKMNYRDETLLKRGKPNGLYWGVYADVFNNTWKFDIFVLNSSDFEKLKDESKELKQKISEDMKEPILKIKSDICNNSLYRKEVYSMDVYNAVINNNVKLTDEFKEWLKKENGISL